MNAFRSEIKRIKSSLLSNEVVAAEICANGIDLSKICRICLCETRDNLLNGSACIINAEGKLVRLNEIFETVTGIKIKSNDKLPHHLCSTCLVIVNNSYTFRIQSQRTDEILRSVVKKKVDGAIEGNRQKLIVPVKRKADNVHPYLVREEPKDFADDTEVVTETSGASEVIDEDFAAGERVGDTQDDLEYDDMEVERLLNDISELDDVQIVSNEEHQERKEVQARLSGAGRKRYKWLIAHGYSANEAFRRAKIPWSDASSSDHSPTKFNPKKSKSDY